MTFVIIKETFVILSQRVLIIILRIIPLKIFSYLPAILKSMGAVAHVRGLASRLPDILFIFKNAHKHS